jgi:MFS transporter, ACS family, hexuronate transporter
MTVRMLSTNQGVAGSRGSYLRWLVIAVFVLSTALNFLDRQIMAALAPTLKLEFHLSNADYGFLISAFSMIYATATPFAGILVDRVGLNAGAMLAVSLWSLAGMATAIGHSFRSLLVCRGALGLGEAAALPISSKANASYLPPEEWALASSAGAVALTLGTIAAPLLAGFMAPRYGWRMVFVLSGALGLLWVGSWRFVSTRIPASAPAKSSPIGGSLRTVLLNRRMWTVTGAYALVMAAYMLWLNWTTVYLVQAQHLPVAQANRYFAWVPPVFATAGGLFNGWLALRWIRGGAEPIKARIRICLLGAPLFLASAGVPFLHSPALAIAAIGISLFACQNMINSLNIIPIDLFGASNAAFSMSVLACAYSLMQTVISPLIGAAIDRFGFSFVSTIIVVPPLLGIWLLKGASGTKPANPTSRAAAAGEMHSGVRP